MFQKEGMGESALDSCAHCNIKASVQKLFLVGIRIDQDLSSHFPQISE